MCVFSLFVVVLILVVTQLPVHVFQNYYKINERLIQSKRVAHEVTASGFLSCYLSGPLPYKS